MGGNSCGCMGGKNCLIGGNDTHGISTHLKNNNKMGTLLLMQMIKGYVNLENIALDKH